MKLPALIAALLIPCASLAQSRVTIPVQDPVYRDLDRLIALRLVEVGLYGQRPYSRREIARLTREAQASVERRQSSAATKAVVARLSRRFADDVRQLNGEQPSSGLRYTGIAEALQVKSDRRAIPTDELGSVDATVNPLLSGRGGRDYSDQEMFAVEWRGEYQLAKGIGVVAQPRLRLSGVDVEAASAVFNVRNVTIEAGRQPIVWGQGMEGGLLFSSSGNALDMVRVSTDLPFRGWFIKGTSPMRGSIIAADLGGNQHFPHSILIAYKLSGHPFTNRVELAASVLGVQGGRGAPKGSFADHVQDLIPALKYLFPDNTTQFSNKMAGWEYRLRLPELSGLQLYAEHAFEDMDPRRWGSTFWEDGGHIFGASLSDLGPDGALAVTTEFHHTGLRFYKHGIFRSGMAFNRTLFGDPLGNQADGGYLRFTWDRGGNRRVTVDAALERRDGDFYRALSDGPEEDNFRFQMLQSVPAEWSSRAVLTYSFEWKGSDVSMLGGYERIRDVGFVRDALRNNYVIGVSLRNAGEYSIQRR